MSIEVNDSRKSYAGNGVTVEFDAPSVGASSELVVTLFDADQVGTVLPLGSGFTFSGGKVTLSEAPAVGETLVITRETALTQPVELEDLDVFPPKSVEQALDKLTRIAQDLNERISRAVLVSAVSDPEDLDTLLTNLAALVAQIDDIDALLALGDLDARYLRIDNPDVAAARTALALGTAAVQNVGSGAGDLPTNNAVAAAIAAIMWPSGDLTITAGASLSVNHPLGVVPDLVLGELVCVTSDPGTGHLAGAVIPISLGAVGTATVDGYGCTVEKTSTQLIVQFGIASGVFYVNKKNAPNIGQSQTVIPGNWRLRLKALVFG